MEKEGEKGKRIITLLCQSVSKVVQIIAEDEQRVDLGSIARAFGIDPNTLKLNGYFISRGVDFVASSVTWKSLIGFFSARGLPTGAADSDAVLVGGKLSQIASKRVHEVEDAGNEIVITKEQGYSRDNKRARRNDSETQERYLGPVDLNKSNSLCLKRKWCLEDENHLKRTRSDEAVSDLADTNGGALPSNRFSCSIINKNLKRMRVDEMVAAPASKRIR